MLIFFGPIGLILGIWILINVFQLMGLLVQLAVRCVAWPTNKVLKVVFDGPAVMRANAARPVASVGVRMTVGVVQMVGVAVFLMVVVAMVRA